MYLLRGLELQQYRSMQTVSVALLFWKHPHTDLASFYGSYDPTALNCNPNIGIGYSVGYSVGGQ